MSVEKAPQRLLDLRKTKCPLNFVQSKLALEKLAEGELIEIWILRDGESALNIPQSLAKEGHILTESHEEADGTLRLRFQKG